MSTCGGNRRGFGTERKKKNKRRYFGLFRGKKNKRGGQSEHPSRIIRKIRGGNALNKKIASLSGEGRESNKLGKHMSL